MRVIHVPTPGDHYSPSTGSAVMTIIYQLNRRHVESGDEAIVVLAPGTRRDYGSANVVETPLGALPSKWQKIVDAACGSIGWERPFSARTYAALGSSLDLEHSHVIIHNTAGPIRSIARRHPSAQICLYANNELFRTFTRREAKRTIDSCHRVICVSEFLADQLSEKLGGRPAQLRVVHNGVDTNRFQPGNRGEDREPVVLFVGRIVPEKGVHLLIQAAIAAHRKGRVFRLRIVGSSGFSRSDPLSSYEKELRAAADPLKDRVEFVPFLDRNRILEEYRDASIFVVPSEWDDPCPLTVGEGMASGLPTIASRRGGIPELGADAVLWFDPPDTGMLATHLIRLIDNPEERRKLGRSARIQSEKFSWEIQYQRFRQAIE